MTTAQITALRAIADTILDAIGAAGPIGAPGGHIYAALMTAGCTFDQYEQIMRGLERAALVSRRGDCYHLTDYGRLRSKAAR